MNKKILKILLFGDPVLRQTAKPVTVFHSKLHSMIDSMADTLYAREDGAAIAANQVGILKRIIIIDYEDEYLELINPVIIEHSGEQIGYEGCLSYPGYAGLVPRADYVKIKYSNRNGGETVIERYGKMARCIQHEMDHLDGILFIDKMSENFLIHSDNKSKVSVDEVMELSNGRINIQ